MLEKLRKEDEIRRMEYKHTYREHFYGSKSTVFEQLNKEANDGDFGSESEETEMQVQKLE